jgi:hypothetical protein
VRVSTILLLVGFASACREEVSVSQTIVWIEAKGDARDMISRIEVRSVGPDGNRIPAETAEPPRWPIKLVFAPKDDDASRRFTLHVDAWDKDGVRLANVQLKTGFARDRTRHARLLLHEACAQRPDDKCGEDAPCHEWEREIAASDLGSGERNARELNVTCDGAGEVPPTGEAGTMAPPPAGSGGSDAGSGPIAGGAAGAAGSVVTDPTGMPMGMCGPGMVWTAGSCEDVNECEGANPCGEHANCENTKDGFTCNCEAGYTMQAGVCTAVHDCQLDNGGCETACDDASGEVRCSCPGEATWLKVDRKACGSFEAEEAVSMGGSMRATEPQFAFDGAGDGLAVWAQSDGMRSRMLARAYRASSGWAGAPETIAAAASGEVRSPAVALDSSGRGVVVWRRGADLWAARYTGESFETPAKIETSDAGEAQDPAVALDAEGDGFAVWMQSDGAQTRVWSNRFVAAGGWGAARPFPVAEGADAAAARLSLDQSGNASVVWTQFARPEGGSPTSAPMASRYDASFGRWTPPVALDDSGAGFLPDVALFEPNGNAVTVWTGFLDGRFSIVARSYAPGVFDNDPVAIASPSDMAAAAFPRLALSPAGSGAALWIQGNPEALMTGAPVDIEIWSNRFDVAAGWGSAERLSETRSTMLPEPHIAVGGNGDGFAVWAEGTGTSRTLRAARLQSDAGFVGNVEVASDRTAEPPASSPPHAAVDAQGNAMVIWDAFEAGRYVVRARAFR